MDYIAVASLAALSGFCFGYEWRGNSWRKARKARRLAMRRAAEKGVYQ